MNKEELWNSLISGEGTRQEAKGIGKFGLGLPQSSMTQCKHVTVYSWATLMMYYFQKINANDDFKNGLGATKHKKLNCQNFGKINQNILKIQIRNHCHLGRSR